MFVSKNQAFSYTSSMENRVKEIRKNKGLTQTQLADVCGTSLRNIQYIEKGERGLEDWIEKISDALEVPIWQLIIEPSPEGIIEYYEALSGSQKTDARHQLEKKFRQEDKQK